MVLAGLAAFLAEYDDFATGGVLLHAGDEMVRLAKNIIAVPWWRVL